MTRLAGAPAAPSTLDGTAAPEGRASDATLPTGPVPMHAKSGGSGLGPLGPSVPAARVNLLPPEVLVANQVRRVKRRSVLALAIVLAGLIGGLMWFRADGSRATASLGDERIAVQKLGEQQLTYAEVLRIQTSGGQVDRALQKVMLQDVAWDQYLADLDASVPSGMELSGVTVSLVNLVSSPGEAVDTPTGSLDGSGQEHVGSLIVTGLAPSHEMVAVWTESLTEIEGFLVPYILDSSVVAGGSSGIQFSVEITLASTVRSLRYDPAAATTVEQGG